MRTLKQRKYAISFPKEEGKTEQAHANDADINQIMARAQRGEHNDYVNRYEAHYGDATGPQYMEANILIAEANSMFEDLPASIRARFFHEPAQFLEFVQDPDNKEELIKLKLATPPKEPPPIADVSSQTSSTKPSEKTTDTTSVEKKGD